LIPQMKATIEIPDWKTVIYNGTSGLWQLLEGGVILIGTITTLVYFHFGARRVPGKSPRRLEFIEGLSGIGLIFVAITFGVIFAGVLAASLVAFIDRIQFLARFVISLIFQG